jgi:hypothetical protein
MWSKASTDVNPALSPPTIDEIFRRAAEFSYGNRLVENRYRGMVAEIVVGAALGPEWRPCSGDWNGWDFEHLISWEIPRLCRGGSRSLTYPAVRAPAIRCH